MRRERRRHIVRNHEEHSVPCNGLPLFRPARDMDTAVSGQFQMKALPKSPLAPILGGMDSRRHAEWPPVEAGSSGDDGRGDGFRGMRPIMTPQLMMAIRLLHMARAELVVQEEDEEQPSDGTRRR